MQFEIGRRIRKFRIQRGMSQKELAEALGVKNNRVSNWEQSLNNPPADLLADICQVLGVSPSELLDVHLSTDELTAKERKVITAYRTKPELQSAVNILLGIEP